MVFAGRGVLVRVPAVLEGCRCSSRSKGSIFEVVCRLEKFESSRYSMSSECFRSCGFLVFCFQFLVGAGSSCFGVTNVYLVSCFLFGVDLMCESV